MAVAVALGVGLSADHFRAGDLAFSRTLRVAGGRQLLPPVLSHPHPWAGEPSGKGCRVDHAQSHLLAGRLLDPVAHASALLHARLCGELSRGMDPAAGIIK